FLIVTSSADHPSAPSVPTRRSSDLEVEQASRRPSDVVRVVQPGRQPVDQAFEHACLPTLVHGEIGPVEDESLVQELQHGNLVPGDRKSTRLNSSHVSISYAVFCLNK